MPIVRITETYWTEEEDHPDYELCGPFGPTAEDYDSARVTEVECDDVAEAVAELERRGLSFTATGADWAGDPDGSYISDYATGERCDTTGHLEGFTADEVAAIIEAVA